MVRGQRGAFRDGLAAADAGEQLLYGGERLLHRVEFVGLATYESAYSPRYHGHRNYGCNQKFFSYRGLPCRAGTIPSGRAECATCAKLWALLRLKNLPRG